MHMLVSLGIVVASLTHLTGALGRTKVIWVEGSVLIH